MWYRSVLQGPRFMSTSRQVGVLLDVDGVLLRGSSVLPAAQRALGKLLDRERRFVLPVVFLTNAGSCQRRHKARQLSQLLQVQVAPEQVVLAHSPLQMMRSLHQKCVLVSGQGPLAHIARSLGFHKVLTIEQLSHQLPLLDMVEHGRTARVQTSAQSLPRIEAIILFGEPTRWETHLQLLVDVLLTGGSPASAYHLGSPLQLPVLACNVDLLWMAEAPSPRFGHGMFLLCLESVYRKLAGRELEYAALLGKPSLLNYQYAEHQLRVQNHNHTLSTIYAVGDNPMTDIYGANLYNRYLAQQNAMTTSTKAVAQGMGTLVKTEAEEQLVSSAAQCRSILVCTGVYKPPSPLHHDRSSPVAEAMSFGHRDQILEPELVEPHYVVEDVEAAVDLLLQETSCTFQP